MQFLGRAQLATSSVAAGEVAAKAWGKALRPDGKLQGRPPAPCREEHHGHWSSVPRTRTASLAAAVCPGNYPMDWDFHMNNEA